MSRKYANFIELYGQADALQLSFSDEIFQNGFFLRQSPVPRTLPSKVCTG
jgi:hypothetical protein